MEYRELFWPKGYKNAGWPDPALWPEGPWTGEPDKVQYEDLDTGLPCLIVRNGGGALCGYVGVRKDHPLHGDNYKVALDINVHGGLTFAGPCHESKDGFGICHTPDPGEDDDIWWLGFDCAHAGDSIPGDFVRHGVTGDVSFGEHMQRTFGYQYRDIGYVREQIASLARQLKDYRDGPTEIEA